MMSRSLLRASLALVALLAAPRPAQAYSSGISSLVFGPAGCSLCHSGGVAPTVYLNGPAALEPGQTGEYVLSILSGAGQPGGGFNASAGSGVLAVGGAFAGGTQSVDGAGGRSEVTHSTPRVTTADTVDPFGVSSPVRLIRFSFTWTAPSVFPSPVLLNTWGNAVNLANLSGGDAPRLATLSVAPAGSGYTCGGAIPREPAIVADTGARACQRAIAKGGALYVKSGLKAIQACLRRVQAGVVPHDPVSICIGDVGTGAPPLDAKTAADLAKAEAKMRGLVALSCETGIASLGLCASTEPAAEDCLLAEHRTALAGAIAAQVGDLLPTPDGTARACQAAIGKASTDFVNAYLKASQKCLDTRNKAGAPAGGVAACIGSAAGGVFTVPTDTKVAGAIAKATSAFSAKVLPSCPDLAIASLDACAKDGSSLAECLACTQREAAFDLLGSQYGGS